MAVCEKTVAELSVTEICTKYVFISEPENHIFKAYGSGGVFCLFFQNLPGWVVPFAVTDSYFLRMRRGEHGNLLESE